MMRHQFHELLRDRSLRDDNATKRAAVNARAVNNQLSLRLNKGWGFPALRQYSVRLPDFWINLTPIRSRTRFPSFGDTARSCGQQFCFGHLSWCSDGFFGLGFTRRTKRRTNLSRSFEHCRQGFSRSVRNALAQCFRVRWKSAEDQETPRG